MAWRLRDQASNGPRTVVDHCVGEVQPIVTDAIENALLNRKHSHLDWPRTPIKTPFAISIITADEILLVTLRFRAGADRDAIECCMFQIADTFAAVEGLSEKELRDLFWEQKRLSRTEHCFTVRRRFSDPEYPQKFDDVFRRLTGQIESARFH